MDRKKRNKRTPRGNVAVQLDKDRLRLYWRYEGKKYYLYTGLPDSQINRTVAQTKANQITIDLATGNFDPSLAKYKPQYANGRGMLWNLYDRFWKWKSKTEAITTPRSQKNYQLAVKLVLRYQGVDDLPVDKVNEAFVYGFIQWAKTQISHETLKTYLTRLKAIWNFGKITPNPWDVRVKASQFKPSCDPFTVLEVKAIIEAYRTHERYSPYADFVEFLMMTGMRIGEVCGLQWSHINKDFSQVAIVQCLTKKEIRPVKCGKTRTIKLNDRLSELLKNRYLNLKKIKGVHSPDFVFLSPLGKPIDVCVFRTSWQQILEALGIVYRKPYTTRKTFISHALANGISPVSVAKMAGHDVNTMFASYAGVIENLSLPELF